MRIFIFCTFLLFSNTSSSLTCPIFVSKVYQKFSAFLKTTYEKKGFNLFLKDISKQRYYSHNPYLSRTFDGEELTYQGILQSGLFNRINHRIAKKIFKRDDLLISFIGRIEHDYLDKPTQYVSGRFYSGGAKEPTMFSRILVGIAVGYLTYELGSYSLKKYKENKVLQAARESKRLKMLLEHDIRYLAIKKKLKKGEIEEDIALATVAIVELQLDSFYKKIISSINNNEILGIDLENLHQVQKPLEVSFKKMVSPSKWFYVNPEKIGGISIKDKMELVEAFNELHLKYILIDINPLFQNEKNKIERNWLDFSESYFSSDFHKSLLRISNEKLMSKLELKYYFQENASWEYQFHFWRILGMKKYKVGRDGLPSDEFLTLKDMQEEILHHVNNSY